MEYNAPKARESTNDIVIEDVIRFFVKFIENAQLGRIANAHVAISDSCLLGVADKTCMELAYAFSLAVDFPKTGILPDMPDAAKNITKYPDFMEKNFNSYESGKVLGKLYRKCKNIVLNNYYSDKIELNPCFVLDGHEKYLESAKISYEKYRLEIERLMFQFECETESDLFLGVILTPNSITANKNSLKVSSILIRNLWTYLRESFFEEFGISHENYSDLPKNIFLKASAWYVACYSHEASKSLRILSFPFILEDLLAIKNGFEIKNLNLLSKSIITQFIDYRGKCQLISRYMEKIELKKYISNLLNVNLCMVGSAGLFLFEDTIKPQFVVYGNKDTDFNDFKDILDENFRNVTCTDKYLSCEEDEETSFIILNSKILLIRYLYIRQVILSNPILMPIFYVIVHFARLDKLFLALSDDKITFEIFLMFSINYFKSINLIKIENNLNFEDMEKMKNNDIKWLNVHDSVALESLDAKNELGSILLKFYYDMAYEVKEFKFCCQFENVDFDLSERVNDALKDHFTNAMNFISKINDLSLIWNLVLSQNRQEPHFTRRFFISRGRAFRNITQSTFMENSSLLLFSNSKNEFDLIEFEFYKGKRRSMHTSKSCYSAKLYSNLNKNGDYFTSYCYDDYKQHCLKQFIKAKEMQSDYDFRFQLKFGNVYFTNIPNIIIEETNRISIGKFREALKHGYKKYKFEFHRGPNYEPPIKEEVIENENSDNECEEKEIKYTSFNFSSNDEFIEEKKKRKKKRKLIKHANSAFDSNITPNNENKLHNIFEKNEFDSSVTNSFIIYLDIRNDNGESLYAYRLKYDFDLTLIKIESLPIKWACVDIRNSNEIKAVSYDIRFTLLSQKAHEFNSSEFENNEKNASWLNFINMIKSGVIQKLNENDESIQKFVVNEYFRNGQIFVRHSQSTIYKGNSDSWKGILQLGGINLNHLPIHVASNEFYELISVSLFDVDEYSDNDEHGLFANKAIRKELNISAKIDINNLKINDCEVLIDTFWYIAQAFENILE